MADSRLTDKTAYAGTLDLADLVHIVDVSDTSQNAAGSSYKLPLSDLKDLVTADSWKQGGNSFATTGVIGTTDANHVSFIVNGVQKMVLLTTGSIQLSGSFVPFSDNTYNIGTATEGWANLYLSKTAGSVLFMGASGLVSQDNANLFYDDTNNRLGLGITSPTGRLHVYKGGNGVLDHTAYFMSSDAITGSGGVIIGQQATNAFKIFAADGGGSGVTLRFGSIVESTGAYLNENVLLLQNKKVNINGINGGATLSVFGEGATSATYSLKIQNSASALALEVRDDKLIGINGIAVTGSHLNIDATDNLEGLRIASSNNKGIIVSGTNQDFGIYTINQLYGVFANVTSNGCTGVIGAVGGGITNGRASYFYNANSTGTACEVSTKMGLALQVINNEGNQSANWTANFAEIRHVDYLNGYTMTGNMLQIVDEAASSTCNLLKVTKNGADFMVIKSTGTIAMGALQVGNGGLSTGDLYVDTAANVLTNGDYVVARKV